MPESTSVPAPGAATAPVSRPALAAWLTHPALPWVVLALALLARLAFALVMVPPRLQWPDSRQYEEIGRLLYEKGTYGLQSLRAPGYPTLIAAIYHLVGPNLVPLRVVEALLSTGAVALLGWLGTRLFGRPAGMLAMALAALHPMLAFLPSTQYTESTAALVTTLILIATFGALERPGVARWLAVGLLIGAQILIRPNTIAFAPGLALGCFLVLRRARRAWIAPALAVGVAAALAVAPWIVRNHAVHGEWFFVSTGGGRALWLGNNPNASNDTRLDYVIDPEARRVMQTLPPHEQDRYLFREAVGWIRAHPDLAFAHYLRKLRNIFALYPDPLITTYVNPASRISQGLASIVLFAGLLLALARVGAEPRLWPPLLGALTYVLATALAFSNLRYRMVVEPALILAAGWGCARVLVRRSAGARTPGPARP